MLTVMVKMAHSKRLVCIFAEELEMSRRNRECVCRIARECELGVKWRWVVRSREIRASCGRVGSMRERVRGRLAVLVKSGAEAPHSKMSLHGGCVGDEFRNGTKRGIPPMFFQRVRKSRGIRGLGKYGKWECASR